MNPQPKPNQPNQSKKSGKPNPRGQGGRPGQSGGRKGSGRPGGQSRSKGARSGGSRPRGRKPSMDALIRSVAKTEGELRHANKASTPTDKMATLDSQDSGMLYPGSQFRETVHEPKDRQSKLRVIPLGGLEEVGMNCMAIEYGDDIIVVDVGWMFPDETMPGVDYVIPDVSYLDKNKSKIRAVLITHGHLDHIGGAPYLLPKLGFPPIYATQFGRAIMEANLEEHQLQSRLEWHTVKYADVLRLGVFKIEFFHVNHNIPEGMGIAITTPVGTIVHTGDFKFDATPVADDPAEFEKIKAIGERGVLLAMCDSTNVEKPGHTVSESEIAANLDGLIGSARGRIIMSTFSTLIARIQGAITSAARHNRKVTIVGRSLLRNVEICQRLGYIEIPKDILIDPRSLAKYPDNEVMILCTGSQANEMSALVRMSTGDHQQVQIKQGDTVILSSTPIPGNERSVHMMMDKLFRLGADVMYSKVLDIHTSGHAYQDELREMLELLKPRHFMPIHGEYRKRVLHGRLAGDVGVPPERVHLLDNGRVLELSHSGDVGMIKEQVGGGLVFVDGLGVGDVGHVVLRDRKHMAEDGMLVIITSVDRVSGKLVGNPEIISRGFIYLREAGQLLGEVRDEVRKIWRPLKRGADATFIKNKIRDHIGEYLYEKTERHPMVLPVVIDV